MDASDNTPTEEPMRRRLWQFLPLVILLAVVGWAVYISGSYEPGEPVVGMNIVDESGRFINGAGGGILLISRGELWSGLRMLLGTGQGQVMLAAVILFLILQVSLIATRRRTNRSKLQDLGRGT